MKTPRYLDTEHALWNQYKKTFTKIQNQTFIKTQNGYTCPVTGWWYKVVTVKENTIKLMCLNKINYGQIANKYKD